MRKILWCCVAAGAAVCCAFGAAAYVAHHPDSALGRCARAACPFAPHGGAATAGPADTPATADADDLVPADPVPVDEPPPLPPPGSHMPPEVAALLTPPIIIHDEEDLNPRTDPARTEPAPGDAEAVRPAAVDMSDLVRGLDIDVGADTARRPTRDARFAVDDGPAPPMPYCTEEAAPAAGQEDVGRFGTAPYHAFDACGFWMGFFTSPSRLFDDSACGRCEEDVHYPQQYSGAPYTGEPGAPAAEPSATDLKPLPAVPGVEEQSEPPAVPKEEMNYVAPRTHGNTPRPSEPQSDTMEMRPSDWKPYSLAPGPF